MSTKNFFPILVLLLLTQTLGSTADFARYFPPDKLDAVALLAPPPLPDSDEQAADLTTVGLVLSLVHLPEMFRRQNFVFRFCSVVATPVNHRRVTRPLLTTMSFDIQTENPIVVRLGLSNQTSKNSGKS
jgi:hypothetical protein